MRGQRESAEIRRAIGVALLMTACSAPPPPPPAPVVVPNGLVSFESDPPGAMVSVDGAAAEKTPVQHTYVAGSSHKILFTLDGFEPHPDEFLTPTSPYSMKGVLRPAIIVAVASDPAGAEVDIDGVKTLAATPGKVPLTHGTHLLTFLLAGHGVGRIQTKEGEAGPLSIKLHPEAFVDMRSFPGGAKVFIDGVDTGLLTPADHVSVAAGVSHSVTFKLGKLSSDAVKVKALKPGQSRVASDQLHDQDAGQLRKKIHQVQAELNHWQALDDKYQRQNDGFIVTDARKAMAVAGKLQQADEKVDELSNELADLKERLDDVSAPPDPP